MNKRLKEIRKYFKLNQRKFSTKINVGQSTVALLENGQRKLRDIHISQICNAFNISEDWLRNGTGTMLIDLETFSLDEYAKKNNLNALDISIIKGYMSLSEDTRKELNFTFRKIFLCEDETVATKEDDIENGSNK